MTLSTWQLIVVAALATIWVVVLGVPLLADLLRWLRSRPPAPRIDRAPADHGDVEVFARPRLQPARLVERWRSQDPAVKRFQVMMVCGGLTTIAMFLAIALRGYFVPLFLITLAGSVAVVAIGAIRSSSEREAGESGPRLRTGSDFGGTESNQSGRSTDLVLPGLLGDIPLTEPDDVPTANPFQSPDGEITIPTLADITEAFRTPDRSGFMFEPLNLESGDDEVVVANEVAAQLSDIELPDVPVDPELAAELGLDVGDRPQPRFSAAPEAGSRQASARARRSKRSKARPVYIESVLDDDNPTKAIND